MNASNIYGGGNSIRTMNYDPDVYDLNSVVPDDTLFLHIDFSDISTMWQNLSKTTQVASQGDPIAYVDNKALPNLIPGMRVINDDNLAGEAPKYESSTTYNGNTCAKFSNGASIKDNEFLIADKYVNKGVKNLSAYLVHITVAATDGYSYPLCDLMDISIAVHGNNTSSELRSSHATAMGFGTLGVNHNVLNCSTVVYNRSFSPSLNPSVIYTRDNVRRDPSTHSYSSNVGAEEYGSPNLSDFNLFALGEYTSIGWPSYNTANSITQHICEFKVFNGYHDAARRTTEFNTLKTKWGIA
jgi:hypothetical protein